MADLALSNPAGSTERVDARRSTRLFQTMSLSISGMNEMGNPFVEMTSVVAFNCHGCLYRSRYHNRPGAWVTLHMPNADTGKAQQVKARVRFVRLPASPKELYQVGVELENPANVWGVQRPPEDWTSFGGPVVNTPPVDAPAVEKSSALRVVPDSGAQGVKTAASDVAAASASPDWLLHKRRASRCG